MFNTVAPKDQPRSDPIMLGTVQTQNSRSSLPQRAYNEIKDRHGMGERGITTSRAINVMATKIMLVPCLLFSGGFS